MMRNEKISIEVATPVYESFRTAQIGGMFDMPIEKKATLSFTIDPIPFDSPDGKPVSLLFVLLVPEQATDLHLQVLSELAQMFSRRQLREALAAAPDAQTLFQLLTTQQDSHA